MLLAWGAESLQIEGKSHFKEHIAYCYFIILYLGNFRFYSFTLFFCQLLYMSLALLLSISALYFIVVNNICSKSQIIRLFLIILVVGFTSIFTLVTEYNRLASCINRVMFNVGNHFAGYMVVIIPLTVAMSFSLSKTLGTYFDISPVS